MPYRGTPYMEGRGGKWGSDLGQHPLSLASPAQAAPPCLTQHPVHFPSRLRLGTLSPSALPQPCVGIASGSHPPSHPPAASA